MLRWIGIAGGVLILLATSFGLSALAVEWRVAGEIEDLRSDVDEIRDLLEPPEVSPSPSPEPASATLQVGEVVEWEGLRLTVDELKLGYHRGSPRAWFTLQNMSATASTAGALDHPRVVGSDGSACRSGLYSYLGQSVAVMAGEQTKFNVNWECPGQVDASTLTLGGGVIFEVPPR